MLCEFKPRMMVGDVQSILDIVGLNNFSPSLIREETKYFIISVY